MLWVLYIWWKLISWNIFNRPITLPFQPSMVQACNLPLLFSQSITTLESPRIYNLVYARWCAIVSVDQTPINSALVFVPHTQFIIHLVTLVPWDLINPPTPQRFPSVLEAPSKHVTLNPSQYVNSLEQVWGNFCMPDFHCRAPIILMKTQLWDGGVFSNIVAFLSNHRNQQERVGRKGMFDLYLFQWW